MEFLAICTRCWQNMEPATHRWNFLQFLSLMVGSAQGAGRLKDLPLSHQNHCPLCDQQETTQYIFASTVFYRFLVARFLTKGEGYCVMWLVADD